jgi:hypothetical protein
MNVDFARSHMVAVTARGRCDGASRRLSSANRIGGLHTWRMVPDNEPNNRPLPRTHGRDAPRTRQSSRPLPTKKVVRRACVRKGAQGVPLRASSSQLDVSPPARVSSYGRGAASRKRGLESRRRRSYFVFVDTALKSGCFISGIRPTEARRIRPETRKEHARRQHPP